jgi:hypothetical protein
MRVSPDSDAVLQICLMVSGIVTDGLGDLLIQYFKLLFNFTVQDVVRPHFAMVPDGSLHAPSDCARRTTPSE